MEIVNATEAGPVPDDDRPDEPMEAPCPHCGSKVPITEGYGRSLRYLNLPVCPWCHADIHREGNATALTTVEAPPQHARVTGWRDSDPPRSYPA